MKIDHLDTKILCIFILLLFAFRSEGQVSSVQFGKNRVQYHNDFDQWFAYTSANVRTYWYGKSRDVGYMAAKIAEKEYPEILDLLEHKMNQKIELLVFSDVTDQNQSNIGTDELLYNESGLVPIHGGKVFLHYTGDLPLLEQKIREGMCGVLIYDMFFGNSAKDAGLQLNYAKNFPQWYLDGLISFAGSEWNTELDNEFRQYIEKTGKLNFKKMAREYPILAGHSFWYFLATNYSKNVIPNLLYLTKINRDLENAFEFVFGVSLNQMIDQWSRFYDAMYGNAAAGESLHNEVQEWKLWKKGRAKMTSGEFSPSGDKVVYAINFQGKYQVRIRDLQTNGTEKIFKYGTRNPFLPVDELYPNIRWMNERDLALIYERRDHLYLRIINTGTKEVFEQRLPDRFERIYGFDVIDDRYLVFSAQQMGNIDLYRYDIRTRQADRYMNDYFADRYPEIIRNDFGTFVSFQSNRDRNSWMNHQSDSLVSVHTSGIWMMDLDHPTNIFPVYHSDGHDDEIVKTTPDQIYFKSLATGIKNLAVVSYEMEQGDTAYARRFLDKIYPVPASEADSVDPGLLIVYPEYTVRTSDAEFLTNAESHIRTAILSSSGREGVFTVTDRKGKYHSYLNPDLAGVDSIRQIAYYDYLDRKRETRLRKDSAQLADLDTTVEFQTDYSSIFTNAHLDSLFRSKTEIFTNLTYGNTEVRPESGKNYLNLERSKIVPYRWQFTTFESSFDVSNEVLFDGLDNYAAEGGTYQRPPTGLLGKVLIKDLFEDYEFEGGVRFPPSFNGAEYYAIFRDDKHRLDKSLSLYRKVQSDRYPTETGLQGGEKYEVLLGQAGVSYPLDFYNSVRAKFTIRQDRNIIKPTGTEELQAPPDLSQRLGLRLEYVFDNSFIYNPNIRNGTRAKFYVEGMKKIQLRLIDGFKFKLDEGYLTTFGLDVRHYLPVLKHSVLALRAGAGVSMGPEKILFYLGGADNEIIPRFNENGGGGYRYNYAYQTVAPNLRGFISNVRSGNNHMLANVELRIPPFQYLFGKNMQSRLLRDFQIVGFFDAGMAWEGKDPYDPNNPINFVEIERPPILYARVQYFRDPFVMGYGFGARINLFGYFIRGDYAWGLDSGVVLKPRIHLSLGYDF